MKIVKISHPIAVSLENHSKSVSLPLVVEVVPLKKTPMISRNVLERLGKSILVREHVRRARISLILSSDAHLKSLNKKFHSRNAVTDVLAFDLKEGARNPRYLFGDIFVSVDRAKAVARSLRIPFKEELFRYCIHGLLHLIGYDDLDLKKKKKMWERQEFLLKKIIKSV